MEMMVEKERLDRELAVWTMHGYICVLVCLWALLLSVVGKGSH